MTKLEINNDNIEFRTNDFINNEMPYVGIYGQYSKLIWAGISKISSNRIDLLPLDLHEDWSIETIPNIYILKNPNFTNQEVNGWIAYIKETFYESPQVESIYYTFDEDKIDVWIIIPKRDFSLLRKLVDSEMNVLDTFETNETNDTPLYQFEFHIMYRGRNNETDLIPQKALRIPK